MSGRFILASATMLGLVLGSGVASAASLVDVHAILRQAGSAAAAIQREERKFSTLTEIDAQDGCHGGFKIRDGVPPGKREMGNKRLWPGVLFAMLPLDGQRLRSPETGSHVYYTRGRLGGLPRPGGGR